MKSLFPFLLLPFIAQAAPPAKDPKSTPAGASPALGGGGVGPAPPSGGDRPGFPGGGSPGPPGAPGSRPSRPPPKSPAPSPPPPASSPAPAPAPETTPVNTLPPLPPPTAAPAPSPVSPGRPSETDTIPAAQCAPGGPSGGKWSPFISAHAGQNPSDQCPTNNDANIHWFMDAESFGCCPQNQYLTTASPTQYACCPCGWSCNGLPPPSFQDWTVQEDKLLIGGRAYVITAQPSPPPSAPTSAPNNAAPLNQGGAGVLAPGQGIYTTHDSRNSQVVLGFVPQSSHVDCQAGVCQTIYVGVNTEATYFGEQGDGLVTQTTATSVLFGTFEGTSCVSTGSGQITCGVTSAVFPTLTTYGVVTRNAAAAKPTGGVGVGGMLAAGALGFAAAVL